MMNTPDVVVVGGGAVGLCTAFELAERGREVLLVDKQAVGSQTSPRAAGFASSIAPDQSVSLIRQRGIEQLGEIAADTSNDFVIHQTGGLKVTMDPAYQPALERDRQLAREQGVEVVVLDGGETSALAPWIAPDPISFSTFTPADLYFDPPDLIEALRARCLAAGVRSRGHVYVEGFEFADGEITALHTSEGAIGGGAFVLTAGAWTPSLARLLNFDIPAVPHRHQLLCTEALPGLVEPSQPTVRVMDVNFYARPDRGGLLAGGYEPNPLSLPVSDFDPALTIEGLAVNEEGLQKLIQQIEPLIPRLASAPIREQRAGLPTLTIDGLFVIDQAPTARNLFFATGCNVGGLATAPSVGEALSVWLADGERPEILAGFGLDRFPADLSESEELVRVTNARYSGLESIN